MKNIGWIGCLLFCINATTGCKTLGLGGLSNTKRSLNRAKRETSRVARDTTPRGTTRTRENRAEPGTQPPRDNARRGGSSGAPKHLISRLRYSLKRLEKRCPLNKSAISKSTLRQCKYAHRNVRSSLRRVKPRYHQEPLYEQVSNYISTLDKKIPEWKDQVANAKASGKRNRTLGKKFKKRVYPHKWMIYTLWKVKNGKKISTMSTKALVLYNKRVKRFKTFVDWCKTGEYKSITQGFKFEKVENPQVTCELASEWKSLYIKYVNILVAKASKFRDRMQRGYMKDLKEKNQLTEPALRFLSKPEEYSAKQRKAYEEVYANLNTTMPKEAFAGLATIAKGYRKLIRRAARKNRFPSKFRFKNGSCRNAFRSAASRKGFSLLRYGMYSSNWAITKNRLGIPLRRYRTGYVLLRKRGERFCRIYKMTATAQYRGGGRYTGASAPSRDFGVYPFTVSRCR